MISAACPACAAEVQLAGEAGHVDCPQCSAPLWMAEMSSEVAAATQEQLETRFGCHAEDFESEEVVELLRAWWDSADSEPTHVWRSDDYRDSQPSAPPEPGDASNPYQPPTTVPTRTDTQSDNFVFRAAAPCDRVSLEWAIQTFAKDSDITALIFLARLIVIGVVLAVVPDFLDDYGMLGTAIGILMLLGLWYVLGKLLYLPYYRTLRRRYEAEPIYAGDTCWLTLRQRTITAETGEHIFTWPLRWFRCLQAQDQLVVLQTPPHRLFFVTSSATTVPESFDAFRKGVKRRCRRNARFLDLSFEIN